MDLSEHRKPQQTTCNLMKYKTFLRSILFKNDVREEKPEERFDYAHLQANLFHDARGKEAEKGWEQGRMLKDEADGILESEAG